MSYQKKDGWCGPAALSYVMHLQGKDVSQEELAKKLHATVSEGTDNEDMIRVAKDYGYQVKVIENLSPTATLTQLESYRKKGNFPILDYLMGSDLKNDGHYSVYMGQTNDTIKLFNVSPGKVEVRDKKNFIAKWKDIGTDAHKKTYNRWAMILL
jgi:ABC-type bacteriocin/lantibiotic exporter with double-glycine peptidase domain